jgi:hypothetical protein
MMRRWSSAGLSDTTISTLFEPRAHKYKNGHQELNEPHAPVAFLFVTTEYEMQGCHPFRDFDEVGLASKVYHRTSPLRFFQF